MTKMAAIISVHIWRKPLKNLLRDRMANVTEAWYTALALKYYDIEYSIDNTRGKGNFITFIQSSINVFRNYWANQSEVSCKSFFGWGNDNLFK